LGSYMQSDDLKIALVNFSEKINQSKANNDQKSFGLFTTIEKVSGLTTLHPNNKLGAIDFVARRDFQKQLNILKSSFDLIFLSADNADAISLVTALSREDVPHISSVRIKKTKSKALKELSTLLPIQGLLYE
jgi:hypothetical protein